MKRALSLILALMMLIGLVPWFAQSVKAVETSVENLRYDDHLDMTGKTVEILDAGTPTSYQVGYGVAENEILDTAVVTMEGETLVATGIGTAKVEIDGEVHEITVTAAPISLLLLIGQSNMQGSEGDENQSIICPDGMVYSTYGDRYTMTTSNATNFAPSALTGAGSEVNVNGTTDKLEEWPVYLLNEDGVGKKGPDSGFAYEWVKQTGEKVWVVNAAHGGSAISTWQKSGANYKEAVALFSACQDTLQKEIDAGHYKLSHMGYFWCQGCSDASQTAEWYVNKYLTMHNNLKTELAFDAETTFEFGGIIPILYGLSSYRAGIYADKNTKSYYESFELLTFNGPRAAQYWMTNNPELPDIWNVCNIGEDWVWMPDGTNGVSEYFQAHYPNGTVDYTTQVAQKASWYTPTTPAAVHDSIHYNQIGYNEVGREAARNALIMLGEIEAPDVETSVQFLGWDGYTVVNTISASATGNSATLVVPKIAPVWKAKEITFELSDGLTWNYYDLLSTAPERTGTLRCLETSSTVSVAKAEPYTHFAAHLADLPAKICCGLNLWNVTRHDQQYFANGTNWGVHSSGDVPSITIMVEPGERIYASSFGAAKTNGSSSTNGIRMTYFSEYGVLKSNTPAETYAEFTRNGGYLIVPEGAVAMNIPMWGESDAWEVYILNRAHSEDEGVCESCGSNQHTHSFSAWETIREPGLYAAGEKQRICTGCGEVETQVLNTIWLDPEFADHLSELPEAVCSDVNIWNELVHDKEFFTYGTHWTVHSSGNVYSVTFTVNPGDKIFATSFGGANVNGHGSSNGIRVTWFGLDGVVKTTDPAGTYAEFSKNGGYLIAPEGAVVVNIPMWNNSDSNEIYILNREHAYENGTCAGCGDHKGAIITQQPESVEQEIGKKFAITVKAEGESLCYQWYVKEAGAKAFKVSVNKTASYAYTMQDYMNGRQVYCVITDANGNQVTTETATITRPPVAVKITEQPQDVRVNVGEKFSISPKVEGEGLTYQWYVKESGAKAFKVSSNKTAAYAYTMQNYMIGRQVYCVITDKYGNTVTTDVATIRLPIKELEILTQPADVYASLGEKFSIAPEVEGEGLTYQWYYKEKNQKKFSASSNKTSAYAYSMASYMNGRSVYCVITDQFGNSVQTDVATIHVK